GRYQEAYRNFDTFFKLHDSLVTKENYQSVSVIQSKYEQSRKDNELLALAAANNRKTLVNKLFAASAVALLVIGLLGYRNFRNRGKIARQQHELQQQKITELEKDKQLLTIDAMLKGQEEERSRIAKDLHDGLGGLLSGTRISFQQVKENLVFTPENLRLFERSMGMLDHTITDLRKVAHNLMPEALARFGLYEAVHDFCNSIRASSGIETTYQLVGEQRKYSDTAAVFIYRIIQELVNNAIKHASASHVMVQLSTGEATTGITVEDNGRGFNKEILLQSRGAGMANIQYRVAYFNGTIDIISEPGSGTSVNIHLKT
ncbi:MAG: hypothetical protein JNM68_04570, partial [Dinghuibacter sp.]|nr:hypothetical protein [Dinghuibacter sp.]